MCRSEKESGKVVGMLVLVLGSAHDMWGRAHGSARESEMAVDKSEEVRESARQAVLAWGAAAVLLVLETVAAGRAVGKAVAVGAAAGAAHEIFAGTVELHQN